MVDEQNRRSIDLHALLGDTTLERFDSEYRDRNFLHVPGALTHEEVRALFPVERFDEIATTSGVMYPDIEVVDDGTPAPPEKDRRGRPIPQVLARRYAKGSTIRIRAIAEMDVRVNELVTRLSDQLDANIQVHAFLTPAGARGFHPHWDVRDAWILQTHGSKTWRIHEQGTTGINDMELPLTGTLHPANTMTVGRVLDEFVLREGDALYLPRGFGHAPECTDEPSIHLTMSLVIQTSGDVAAKYLHNLHRARRDLRQRVSHAELGDVDALARRLEADGMPGPFDADVLARTAGDLIREFTKRAQPLSLGSIAKALRGAPPGGGYRYQPVSAWRTAREGDGHRLFVGDMVFRIGRHELAMLNAIAAGRDIDIPALERDHPTIDVEATLEALEAAGVVTRG